MPFRRAESRGPQHGSGARCWLAIHHGAQAAVSLAAGGGGARAARGESCHPIPVRPGSLLVPGNAAATSGEPHATAKPFGMGQNPACNGQSGVPPGWLRSQGKLASPTCLSLFLWN